MNSGNIDEWLHFARLWNVSTAPPVNISYSPSCMFLLSIPLFEKRDGMIEWMKWLATFLDDYRKWNLMYKSRYHHFHNIFFCFTSCLYFFIVISTLMQINATLVFPLHSHLISLDSEWLGNGEKKEVACKRQVLWDNTFFLSLLFSPTKLLFSPFLVVLMM